MMPILSYFAVVGSTLLALLFAADAMLPKGAPVVASSEFYGMPKPWRPDPAKQILAAIPAPEPDMTSAAVAAAAPPAALPAAAAKVATVAAQSEPLQAARAEAAPKKKRVVRKHPRPAENRRDFAWRNSYDGGFFGGGNSMFGRF
jgi:hypothetical protein